MPGFLSSGWLVLMAPAGTPDAIMQKVNADMRTVLQIPEVVERFDVLGTYARLMSPARDRRVHAQRGAAVVAGRAADRQQSPPALVAPAR